MKLFTLNEDFNRKTMSDVSFFLLDCKKDGKTAVLLISSNGGDPSCLEAIVDVIRATKVPLITIGRGYVASCAAGLFCFGDERYLLPSAQLMIHNVGWTARKDTRLQPYQAEKIFKEETALSERLVALLGGKTRITSQVFNEKCGHGADWILTPDEWEKYGVVTDTSERWLEIIEKARG